MNLLMISGDRSLLAGKRGAFWYTLEAFSKEWDRIDVICPHGPSFSDVFPASLFGNVFLHPCPRGLWYQPQWILKKGKALHSSHHHAVMTVQEYPPFYNGLVAWLLHRAVGIPYALEVHHLVGVPRAASVLEQVGKGVSWLFLPLDTVPASAVRAVSRATADRLIRWGVRTEKVHVVPSFYLDRALLTSIDASGGKRFDVAFGGRLVPNKGVPELLQAIASIPHATLLIVGDGPLRGTLEALARSLQIEHRVEFRGWLPTQHDVLMAIASSKMLVMNSTSEGGPRIALEAMGCGVPVIATRVGVMPEVIQEGQNGLFTNGTPEDLAEKISLLLQDSSLRERMGQHARAVLDRFERGHLIGQYARFLKGIARSPADTLPSHPLRLLFITQKLHGQDTFVLQWAAAFAAQGYRVTVLCLEWRPEGGGRAQVLPFDVVSLGKERGYGRVRQVLRFLRLILELRYDRVFIHMSPVWGLVGAPVWILRRVPVYLWYTHYKMQAGLWLLGHYAKRLFCATPQSLPQYEGNPKKVVVGHGIDLAVWPKRANAATDPYRLLMVHRLSRSKRVELTLQALTLLPDYRLDIYGVEAEPEYVEELRAFSIHLGLQERVTFHGTVPVESLPALYTSAFLILNMASETIDKTMLEAMTCGCYPVTTKRNAEAIGIPSAPETDTPASIAAFVHTYQSRAPIDAETMYEIVAEGHGLNELIVKMDRYMREGT